MSVVVESVTYAGLDDLFDMWSVDTLPRSQEREESPESLFGDKDITKESDFENMLSLFCDKDISKEPDLENMLSVINNLDQIWDKEDLPCDEEKVFAIKKELQETIFSETDEVLSSVSSAGATNFNSTDVDEVILHKDCWSSELQQFKLQSHCSLEVAVSFGIHRFGSLKLTKLKRELLEELFAKADIITLTKRPLKESVLKHFLNDDITKKRGLAVCDNVVRGLALYEKENELVTRSDISGKKLNNVLTNYQRIDRSAGDSLTSDLLRKYRINSICSDYNEIEEMADCSFDIFDKKGFMAYTSPTLKKRHLIFYDNKISLYLVKAKYLDAFGKKSPVNKRRNSNNENSPKKIKVEL